MGRPTKLTPELQAEICKTLRAGVDVETACLREGIGRRTFYEWRARGEEGEEPFAEFLAETEKVMADLEAKVTVGILKASTQNWQAGAWWLRFRKTGGKNQVELSTPGGKGVIVLSESAADEIRRKILFGETTTEKGEGGEKP